MRTIAIGDLHGCMDEYSELLSVLRPTEEDRVVSLGDFMDKGPYPATCVRYTRIMGYEAVLGNHEDRHIRWRSHENKKKADSSYKNPMNKFSDPHDLNGQNTLNDKDIDWLRKLPTMIDLGEFEGRKWIAVHGGLVPGKALEDQPRDAIIRLRWMTKELKPVPTDYSKPEDRPAGTVHWTELYDGPYSVVFGHEAFSLTEPYVKETPSGALVYGIDTGCVHGGHLTALVLEEKARYTISVKSRKVYKNPLRPIPA